MSFFLIAAAGGSLSHPGAGGGLAWEEIIAGFQARSGAASVVMSSRRELFIPRSPMDQFDPAGVAAASGADVTPTHQPPCIPAEVIA
jgi:hypothetical protein